jgi:hypothetical protein
MTLKNMYPYSVDSKFPHVGLYLLDDGRFQTTKQGKLSPFMHGSDYILLENKLADFLASLNIPHIEFEDAIVWNRGRNEEYFDYKELIFKKSIRFITEENIDSLDLEGLQVYLMAPNHLFVSPGLKELLQKAGFDYLRFFEGFNGFAA